MTLSNLLQVTLSDLVKRAQCHKKIISIFFRKLFNCYQFFDGNDAFNKIIPAMFLSRILFFVFWWFLDKLPSSCKDFFKREKITLSGNVEVTIDSDGPGSAASPVEVTCGIFGNQACATVSVCCILPIWFLYDFNGGFITRNCRGLDHHSIYTIWYYDTFFVFYHIS